MTLHSTTMPSPVGELTLVASEAGLRAVIWEADGDRVRGIDAEPAVSAMSKNVNERVAPAYWGWSWAR